MSNRVPEIRTGTVINLSKWIVHAITGSARPSSTMDPFLFLLPSCMEAPLRCSNGSERSRAFLPRYRSCTAADAVSGDAKDE